MSDHLTDTQVHDLCDEALPESESLALRQHLDGCASCRDRMVRLEALLAAAATAPTPSTVAARRARLAGTSRTTLAPRRAAIGA